MILPLHIVGSSSVIFFLVCLFLIYLPAVLEVVSHISMWAMHVSHITQCREVAGRREVAGHMAATKWSC